MLHATGPRSQGKMQALAEFLGKAVGPNAQYPHVKTTSSHGRGERPPPADEPDPNEELWGDWNGRVPDLNSSQISRAKSLSRGYKDPARVHPGHGLESKSADKDAADACTVCGTGNNCCGEGGSWGRKTRPWRESTCPSQHTYEEGQAACLELLKASSAQGPSSGASAEQAEGTDAEEDMCPGRPHVRRESANCHSKVDQEVGQTKPE